MTPEQIRGPWIKASKQQPDPTLGCVVYRLRRPEKRGWFCGIAYFTVSGTWRPDIASTEKAPWGQVNEDSLEWMELPL